MEMAAIMAIALANGGGKPPDWEDFVGIIVLLVINSTISFIEGESFCRTFEVEKFQICPVQNLTSEWSSEFVMSGHIFHH
jgi:hypothetical protein